MSKTSSRAAARAVCSAPASTGPSWTLASSSRGPGGRQGAELVGDEVAQPLAARR